MNVGTRDNVLQGVAATSGTNAWAVGAYLSETKYLTHETLIEHWDGAAWTVVPSPNVGTGDNDLYGVAALATSISSAWAVGDYGHGMNAIARRTLIEHCC